MRAIRSFLMTALILPCFLTSKETTIIEPSQTKDVIYIPQNDRKSCATTSLAMAITYYEKRNDHPLDKEAVWRISETDEKAVYQYGNDMDGLKKIANHFGYQSEFVEQMTISDLEHHLAHGALAILNIQTSHKNNTMYYAVLVIGYDQEKRLLYILDPANPSKRTIPYDELHSHWKAHLSSPRGFFEQSGFIIYPKSPCK